MLDVTEAEWEVLRIVWAMETIDSKTIVEILEKKKNWTVSTTKTLLRRLVQKNILETKKIGNKFLYNAIIEEQKTLEEMTENLLEKICAKKTVSIVEKIIAANNLSKDNINTLITMLEKQREIALEEVKCNCTIGQCRCKKC